MLDWTHVHRNIKNTSPGNAGTNRTNHIQTQANRHTKRDTYVDEKIQQGNRIKHDRRPLHLNVRGSMMYESVIRTTAWV